MGVNSVMNLNKMNSLLNSVYKINDSQPSVVPKVSSVDTNVKNDYTSNSNFEKDIDTKLNDVYQKSDSTYDMPVTYNKSGDLSVIKNDTPSIGGISPTSSNIESLLQSNDSVASNDLQSILSQYTAIETKTFQPNISSALSANIYNSNNTAGSLANVSMQNTGNFINTFV